MALVGSGCEDAKARQGRSLSREGGEARVVPRCWSCKLQRATW